MPKKLRIVISEPNAETTMTLIFMGGPQEPAFTLFESKPATPTMANGKRNIHHKGLLVRHHDLVRLER